MTISISKRKLAGGRISIYLDFSLANGKRMRRAIGIVLDKPTSREIRIINRLKMEKAKKIKAKYELETVDFMYSLPKSLPPITLQDAFSDYVKQYHNHDVAVVRATGAHLAHYISGRHMWLRDVTPDFCSGFWEYLHTCGLKGSTPSGYFKKFRHFLSSDFVSKHLPHNPAAKIRAIVDNSVPKQILTADELRLMFATPCLNEEVKRCFLFSCNTGLRWSDITRLKRKNIDIENHKLTIVQRKVARHSRAANLEINLNKNALSLLLANNNIIGLSAESYIFRLPSYNHSLRVIKKWVEAAGINKHITFHCARHTFITNLIISNVHLSTVASLAGHSSTRHTERYVHIADKQREDAVERLPTLKATKTL